MTTYAPSSRFLSAPTHTKSRRRSNSRPRDDVDEFLSSDLELSFASNVSLNSPPCDSLPLTPDESDYPKPMDISPAPLQPTKPMPLTRPRAFTSAARMFGNDVSNNSVATPYHEEPISLSKGSSTHSSKKTQRAALPFEWMSAGKPSPFTTVNEVADNSDDAMDVDTSFRVDSSPAVQNFDLAPKSAAPSTSTFNNLFYETASPQRFFEESPCGPQTKKRRSHSPDAVNHSEQDEGLSSPGLGSSPSQHKLQRLSSGPVLNGFSKPGLEGLGCPPAVNGLKRPRRPVLSALVHPSDTRAARSACPVFTQGEGSSPSGEFPPARRAFSALIPPSAAEQFSEESSFDSDQASSPAAQAYAQRQHAKTIRRCDGTEDFRPLTGATALKVHDSPRSFLGVGLPGFGDNEAHGKILPCHRVREDGLMRIKWETLDALLNGVYDGQIRDYHIIDCRFDYEYNGGHIPGAVNINTTPQVEDLLLGPSLMKPRPSVSGDPSKKTILVFHCEFSAKRAPTLAKHLRAKDRALNNHVYPKIHYPEVYILEGGYCEYFRNSAARCEPSKYVRMDDPKHAASSRDNMDQFRTKTKFGRHRSYAYGDGLGKSSVSSQQQHQPKRNTAPSGGPTTVFAAASAARSRRGGVSLMTLAEDVQSTPEAGEETDAESDLGDSPCPPPTKAPPVRGKKLPRPLLRAETYGPARMPALGV